MKTTQTKNTKGVNTNKIFIGLLFLVISFKVNAQFTTNGNNTILTNTGNVGLGISSPLEKLDVDGGIRLGNSTSTNNGTIRFNGFDFEGYAGGMWRSLTPPLQVWNITGGALAPAGDFNVSISKVYMQGMLGTPPPPPIFRVNSITPVANSSTGLSNTIFSVEHDRINATKGIIISNAGLSISRTTGSTAGTAFSILPAGVMTLNTNGVSSHLIGFFMNSNNRNFFTVTEQQILYKNATQDLFKVDANGNLYTRKAIVTLTNPYPDYVFEKNYKLRTLAELEAFIAKYHHLPNVPSLAEVEANNKQMDIGEMQVKLLEKVEELTLYILQQQKEIEALKAKLDK